MIWQKIEKAAAGNMQPVSGGYSQSKTGLVTLADGRRVYVKMAVDRQTQKWIERELVAYHWFEKQQYEFAPRLVAEGPNGFALPDLSARDWSNTWSRAKLDAALQAMEALAGLSSKARGIFPENGFGDNPAIATPWTGGPTFPKTINDYKQLAPKAVLERAAHLVHDKQLHKTYAQLASAHPWHGTDLVHYDVRADNFAYDQAARTGVLVDWNWLCFGSKKLDQTALLVNAQWAGYNVLPHYAAHLDKHSLAWFVGFWLSKAAKEGDANHLQGLRRRWLECAVIAHELLQAS